MWHHIAKAWKAMSSSMHFLPRIAHEDIMQLKLWWTNHYHGLEIGIMMDNAFVMYTILIETIQRYMR